MSKDRIYYEKHFPAEVVSHFLMRHTARVQQYREIALLWKINGKPTWQRFNAYRNAEKMREDLTRRLPVGVYIGPVCVTDPTLRWVIGQKRLRAMEHKIIFDIDLTDYNDIRRCPCVRKESGLRVCSVCWPLAACALGVLRNLLCYKFGFHEFLCTFSGSKGVHCWVLDNDAQTYEDNSRQNMALYFQPFIDSFARTIPLHCPVLAQCYENILRPFFEQYMLGKLVDLRSQHGLNLLRVCITANDPTNDTTLLDHLPAIPNQPMLWEYIQDLLLERYVDGPAVIRSMVFMCCFPRLDKDISTSTQHLIRCPFSINGAGGKVCIPLRYQDSLEFVPEKAPDAGNIAATLGSYLKILEEALEAPWARLWVCRCCQSSDVWVHYSAENIFYTAEAWREHHTSHNCTHQAHESTLKAILKKKNPSATADYKKQAYATLLEIKNAG